jgi:hypothetical protein
MSKQISIKPFVYRDNSSTLDQRFEEWLEMYNMAAKVDEVKAENTKRVSSLKHWRGAHGGSQGQTKGLNRKLLTEHLKPQVVLFTEVMAIKEG